MNLVSKKSFKTVIKQFNVPEKVEHDEACLVIISGAKLGYMIPLNEEVLSIGRSEECDVYTDDPLVSREHARVYWEENQVILEDLGSTNGILCNFDKVEGKQILENGDKVSIGDTIFKFLTDDSIDKAFHGELYKLAVLDGLTQVFNKKHFEEVIVQEFIKSKRYGRKLSLAFCDIDFFKKINDEHGHQAGDYVLRMVSKVVKSNVRESDIVCRYGGEEFVILFTNQAEKDVYSVAERIRLHIEMHSFHYGEKKIPVTMSLGISELNEDHKDVDSFVQEADERLYQAKEQGRNQIVGS